MIQLNLLPDLKKEFIATQKKKAAVITGSIFVTLGAVGICVLMFIYVFAVQNLQITLATNDIKNKTQELNAIEDLDKYLTIQNQLSALDSLHNQKGLNSRMLGYLNTLNPSRPNNVSLSSLEMLVEDNSATFTGVTNNFETLNVFVDTLKNADISYAAPNIDERVTEKMFDQVILQNSSLTKNNSRTVVAFTIRTIYKPSAFDAANIDVRLTVPNITTTKSVTQSPRADIFNGGTE